MIVYLPEIYPDELVYSWFCRYAVHSGYTTNKQALQDLYCKKSDTPIKEFIGNLNPDARKCINKMYPLRELVLNHTMYPQYARFIPLEQKKDTLYKLCHENCDVHHLFAVLPRCKGERYMKYCPVCAKEDRQKYGEAYWHRKHQIRNMLICPKHKCLLKDSAISAISMNTYSFTSAEEAIMDREESFSVKNELQIKFAEYTEQVFDATVDFNKDIPLSSILYYAMKDTEYMKSTGSCRYMTKFVNDMKCFYEQIELNDIASISRIQRILLSGNRYDFSLACQIAFFLKMSVNELVDSRLTQSHIKQEEDSHYIKGNDAPDWEEYDREMSQTMEQLAMDIYNGNADHMGRPAKVTEKNICKILEIKEHRLENMPRCRAILKKYSESYPESWARKIVWAYRYARKERDIIYWSDIRKLSGVKKNNFEMVKEYLGKYACSGEVDDIIKTVSGNRQKNNNMS